MLLLVGTGRGRVMLQQSYLKLYCCVSWNVLIQHSRIIVVLFAVYCYTERGMHWRSNVCVCVFESTRARRDGGSVTNIARRDRTPVVSFFLLCDVWVSVHIGVCARARWGQGVNTLAAAEATTSALLSPMAHSHTHTHLFSPHTLCRVHRQ